jgi:hypothetical protein
MVSTKVIVIGTLMLSGCSLLPPTEHPSPNLTINRWQMNCANLKAERGLLERNLRLVDKSKLEHYAVAREKIGIINQKLLDSDELCGTR